MAQSKLALLQEAIAQTQEDLIVAESRGQTLKLAVEALSQQIRELTIAISNDTVGQRIENLKRDIEQHEQQKQNRKKQAEKYDRLAKLKAPIFQS